MKIFTKSKINKKKAEKQKVSRFKKKKVLARRHGEWEPRDWGEEKNRQKDSITLDTPAFHVGSHVMECPRVDLTSEIIEGLALSYLRTTPRVSHCLSLTGHQSFDATRASTEFTFVPPPLMMLWSHSLDPMRFGLCVHSCYPYDLHVISSCLRN